MRDKIDNMRPMLGLKKWLKKKTDAMPQFMRVDKFCVICDGKASLENTLDLNKYIAKELKSKKLKFPGDISIESPDYEESIKIAKRTKAKIK